MGIGQRFRGQVPLIDIIPDTTQPDPSQVQMEGISEASVSLQLRALSIG
jgi:hypothetical protein